MKTLGLVEAAAMLRVHPNTLRDRDKAVHYAEFDGEQGTDWCIA